MQRFSWIVAAIVFLAPVSGFGEKLETGATVVKLLHHDVSPALSDIAPAQRPAGVRRVMPIKRHPLPSAETANPNAPAETIQTSAPAPSAPTVGTTFEGVGIGIPGYENCCAPPDTNGDVGINDYVQTVNIDMGIWTKGGSLSAGFPKPTNTIWAGFGGHCQSMNDGDPIVLYDQLANRWIVSQFAVSSAPYTQCVAVSQTADPRGAYNRYAYSFGNDFNDYPKIGVWPDGYYITYNMFRNGSTFVGSKVCAMDRAKMLAGQAATQQCFDSPNGSLLPSDLDGNTLPPAGAPNYLVRLNTTASLQFYKFHVDWATPANSTLTGPVSVPVATFATMCNGGACVEQPGTRNKLDTLSGRVMNRLAYRNFGTHESLVVNHSVKTGKGKTIGNGIRWYELRNPAGAAPTVHQQGTFAPVDGVYRWMGSVAMDKVGNIGAGYSTSGKTLSPSIRYTGRLAGDAPGTFTQGETVMASGTGAQEYPSRWGDYSSINVDPVDDCTFWYTTEYTNSAAEWNWQTKIGSFKLPGCN